MSSSSLARQILRSAHAGDDAQGDLGQGKAGAGAGVDKVASQGQLQATAIRVAVDGSDHGQGQVGEGDCHALKNLMLSRPLRARHAVALFEVATGAKNLLPRAREQHAAHRAGVLGQALPQRQQLLAHAGVDGVAKLRPVERDLQHMVAVGLQGEGVKSGVEIHRQRVKKVQYFSASRPMPGMASVMPKRRRASQ